jgi:hypothetical protein
LYSSSPCVPCYQPVWRVSLVIERYFVSKSILFGCSYRSCLGPGTKSRKIPDRSLSDPPREVSQLQASCKATSFSNIHLCRPQPQYIHPDERQACLLVLFCCVGTSSVAQLVGIASKHSSYCDGYVTPIYHAVAFSVVHCSPDIDRSFLSQRSIKTQWATHSRA